MELLEVPPPHYTLQPAGQTGGGLHPGRRSPGGDGGEMGEGNGFLRDNRSVFQIVVTSNPVVYVLTLSQNTHQCLIRSLVT